MMNWWKRFWSNPYKWGLWHWIGGRPWTDISRDIYHKFEYLILVSLFTGGYFLGTSGLVSWRWFIVIMAAYTIGYIHGHFFWTKEWKEYQKEG